MVYSAVWVSLFCVDNWCTDVCVSAFAVSALLNLVHTEFIWSDSEDMGNSQQISTEHT